MTKLTWTSMDQLDILDRFMMKGKEYVRGAPYQFFGQPYFWYYGSGECGILEACATVVKIEFYDEKQPI